MGEPAGADAVGTKHFGRGAREVGEILAGDEHFGAQSFAEGLSCLSPDEPGDLVRATGDHAAEALDGLRALTKGSGRPFGLRRSTPGDERLQLREAEDRNPGVLLTGQRVTAGEHRLIGNSWRVGRAGPCQRFVFHRSHGPSWIERSSSTARASGASRCGNGPAAIGHAASETP